MFSMKGIKSSLCRRKNPDRVYLYREKDMARSIFRKLTQAIGLKSKDKKYHPEKFQHSVSTSSSNSTKSGVMSPSINTYVPTDEELELEVIELVEVPRDESEGEQEEPLPLIIAFEYGEEEMPVWFHFGYGCDQTEVEFSWLRFLGFKSDNFV